MKFIFYKSITFLYLTKQVIMIQKYKESRNDLREFMHVLYVKNILKTLKKYQIMDILIMLLIRSHSIILVDLRNSIFSRNSKKILTGFYISMYSCINVI